VIHRHSGALHLAILRAAVFGIWFGILFDFDTQTYSQLPPELIDLHVLSGVIRALATPALLTVVKAAALVGCLLCVLGVRPFPAVAGPTSLLVFTLDVAMKSVGSYANHAQTLVLLLVLLLPFFPAADALSVHRRPAPERSPWLYRVPLVVAATIVVASYSFIGARRLFVGGVSVYADGSMVRWVVARTLEEGAHHSSVGLGVLDHPWLAVPLVLGMLVTTVVEILSPLALVKPRFRWVWLAVIAGFHLSTLFLMDIFFWENLVLLAVLFTPLADRLPWRTRTPETWLVASSP